MDKEFLSSIIPIAVALTAGFFAYFTAISTKEKEVKIKKYEDVGLEIFKYLEDMSFFVSSLIVCINNELNKMTKDTKIPIYNLQKIYLQNKNTINAETARHISISLAFIDKKIRNDIEDFFNWYESEIRKNFSLSTISDIREAKKVDFTACDLEEINKNLNKINTKIHSIKESAINGLSDGYYRTLTIKKSTIIKYFLIVAVLVTITYLTSTKTEKEVRNIYEIHVSGEGKI